MTERQKMPSTLFETLYDTLRKATSRNRNIFAWFNFGTQLLPQRLSLKQAEKPSTK